MIGNSKFQVAALSIGLTLLQFGEVARAQYCGVTSSQVIAQFEQDCQVNSAVTGSEVPDSCKELSRRKLDATLMEYHKFKGNPNPQVAALEAADAQGYVAYVTNLKAVNDPWGSLVEKSVGEAAHEATPLSQFLLNSAFSKDPTFAKLPKAAQEAEFAEILLAEGNSHSKAAKDRAVKYAFSKIGAVDQALESKASTNIVAQVMRMVSKLNPAAARELSSAARQAQNFKGLLRVGNTAMKVLPWVAAAEALWDISGLAAKNCQAEETKYKSFYPLATNCRPTTNIPEFVRYNVVTSPQSFEEELNKPLGRPHPPNETCMQYTRYMVHRNSLAGDSKSELRDVDFKCAGNGDVASFSFHNDSSKVSTDGVTFDTLFNVTKTANGNFQLKQTCGTGYGSETNWRAPIMKTATATEYLGPQRIDKSGYAVCMDGAETAPTISFATVNAAYETMHSSCNAANNSLSAPVHPSAHVTGSNLRN